MAIVGTMGAALAGTAGLRTWGESSASPESIPGIAAVVPSGLSDARERVLKAFDANGDGRLDREERDALRERARQWALGRFDADGDGRLSESERAAMKRAFGEELKRFRAEPASPPPSIPSGVTLT